MISTSIERLEDRIVAFTNYQIGWLLKIGRAYNRSNRIEAMLRKIPVIRHRLSFSL